MSKVEISKVTHEVFGNCVRLTNGIIELWVTVDFGPRIIHFSRTGKENIFYEDVDMAPIGEPLDVYGGDVLKVYGGHRLWLSPEIMPRCYYPDNKPVKYTEIANGAEFTPPIEAINGIQKTMTIVLDEDEPNVAIDHGIKNCGQWEIELAPWAITCLDKGAVQIAPMPASKTGFLPNRNIVLWDYSNMNDSRIYWGKDFITLRQDKTITNPFKLGFYNEAGWCAVLVKGQAFFKFFEPVSEWEYPDGGCNYEAYTNGHMIESESLGALELLQPGEWANHIEEWSLYEEEGVSPTDEEDIRRIVSKYV